MSIRDELVGAISNADFPWENEFDAWSKRVFEHQFKLNAPYRKFCEGRGISPADIQSYRDIPAVPTDVFKHVDLSTSQEHERVFQTSGTTQGLRGSHHFVSLAVYSAAIEAPFRTYCLPKRNKIAIAALAPSPGDLQDSSLSFWLGELVQRCGDPMQSGFFFSRDDKSGELEFDIGELVDWLDRVRGPVFLIGTAFAFVNFFDACDLTWQLPAGSRVLETGGLKGRTREVTREELYGLFADRLGIPATHALSEYSMTELSSQAYTDTLQRGIPWNQAKFRTPAWAKVEVVDPVTMEVLDTPGARGLIRWYDLANLDSVMAIQTSDLGIKHADGGFELLGRASNVELRGCSLTVEEITGAS